MEWLIIVVAGIVAALFSGVIQGHIAMKSEGYKPFYACWTIGFAIATGIVLGWLTLFTLNCY